MQKRNLRKKLSVKHLLLRAPQKKENHPVLEQGVKVDTIIILSLTIPYYCAEDCSVEFKYMTPREE